MPTTRARRAYLLLWLSLWPVLLACHLYPIRVAALRLLMILLLAALWLGPLPVWRRSQAVRAGGLMKAAGVKAAIAVFVALAPGRRDPPSLRQRYVAALPYYLGTPYVWGGETWRGIDCSGLVRQGLVDAYLQCGINAANPAMIRSAASLWWDDCSARALGQEYHGRTSFLYSAPGLNSLDYSRIKAGDFAVTSSGVHTLAYLGNHTWIEADPNEGVGHKVVEVRVPSRNPWFQVPVRIMRWRAFEP